MPVWKRVMALAYIVSSVILLALYLRLLLLSSLEGAVFALAAVPFALCAAGTVAAAAGAVRATRRGDATLKEDGQGSIRIEREALESTARRAAGAVAGARVAGVSVKVAPRRGVPAIDVGVEAEPAGDRPLMETASAIQSAVKESLETFTGREVRYVSVSFVEPRGRGQARARHAGRRAGGRRAPVVDTDAVIEDADEEPRQASDNG